MLASDAIALICEVKPYDSLIEVLSDLRSFGEKIEMSAKENFGKSGNVRSCEIFLAAYAVRGCETYRAYCMLGTVL